MMAIDLSLDRLAKLLPYVPYTRPTLHIAGTNGKGSVSAMLASILLSSTSAPQAALRVGRFNSPHLVSVLDSIILDNVPVTQAVYDCSLAFVRDADLSHDTHLTSFELLTLTALHIFETHPVDIVVLEVGMGGRLDSTNVVPDSCIMASGLTAVDLDHQAFLGDTVEKISREKAGIARAGKPFILGRQVHAEVEAVVGEVVAGVSGVLIPATEVRLDEVEQMSNWSILDMDPTKQGTIAPPPQAVRATLRSFPGRELSVLLPLHGTHQLGNLGTALGMIDALLSFPFVHEHPAATVLNLKARITFDAIVQGIQNVRWPGRLSFHTLCIPLPNSANFVLSESPTKKIDLVVLADGAHNPASASTLGSYITRLLELTNMSFSKPISQIQTVSAPVSVPITYIIALSHSPPKTPLQTLGPILPPSLPSLPSLPSPSITPKTSVALLRFTPPEGMPWVKAVPPTELREVVQELMPDLGESDIWLQSEMSDVLADDGRGTSLEDALRWTAEKQTQERKGLVVLAGSLYLVADFYRLLARGSKF